MMWKLLLAGMILYVAYMLGHDQGLPEQRRIAALERRMLAVEVYLKAQHAMQAPKPAPTIPEEASPQVTQQPM